MLAPSFRRTSVLALILVVACETGARDARAPTPAPTPTTRPTPLVTAEPTATTPTTVAAPTTVATAIVSTSALPCDRRGQRRLGTACCESPEGHERRNPGQVILRCEGPRVGRPCSRKGDCDIACFCHGHQIGPAPQSYSGPREGSTGITGVCGGTLWAGAWMCQLDENGKVTPVIID